MDTMLRLMSRETGVSREYLYDPDEERLWVTDYDTTVHATGKRYFNLSWNPIEQIRAKALARGNITLDSKEPS